MVLDNVTIGLLIPLAASVLANMFILAKRVKKSTCCGSSIEMADTPVADPPGASSSGAFAASPRSTAVISFVSV